MEHRCSQRKKVRLDVTLYRNGRAVSRCKSRDIGLEGMFIEAGGMNCPVNSRVEVELAIEDGNKSVRLPAIVVRSYTDGISIMFLANGNTVFHTMKQFLYRPLRPQVEANVPLASVA